MKTKNYIFIDGKQTRIACDQQAGQPHGINKLCQEKDLSPVTLHEICRNGYGTMKTVKKFMDAGVPIIRSTRPIPSRLIKEHSRTYRRGKEQKAPEKLENFFRLGDELIEIMDEPKKTETQQIDENITFEEFMGETTKETAKVKQMRDVIIKGLMQIVIELNKI